MTAEALRQDVLGWIAENPRAPRRWIALAKRLAEYQDMLPAWRELAKHGIPGRHVMSMAIQAADAAARECARLPSAEEAARLQDVEDAARALIEAIERAPLLEGADLGDIGGKPVMLAWRASGRKTAEGMDWPWQVIEMTELLDALAQRVRGMREGVPPRAVKRQREDPEAAAFVRHMAALIEARTENEMRGTVARIATAALDRKDGITKEQVAAILRRR